MNLRRRLLQLAGFGAFVNAAAWPARQAAAVETNSPRVTSAPDRHTVKPIRTPNGWTLPHTINGGVKEFHLVAEEIEHEFAPGSVAKCWGYNGTTPGPTIEATEGDRVRIFVTNRLPEHTTIHWHGLLLPSGMDGVGGLSQPHIKPGETYAYEFDLKQHGTHMYHPHADEMVQMALGMMGMFVIHPRDGEPRRIDRDYCVLLHNWSLHPGTYRPNPSVMVDFDLWTMNSKVFPAIDPLVARSGERVRIRVGNLSMWNHPVHMHGAQFHVTGSDGGRWPESAWRTESTEIVGVGQTRDLEFTAVPGDWIFHCHMAHHTMNAMGHNVPNPVGVEQESLSDQIRDLLPGYMAMGTDGMAEHQTHTDMGHNPGPENTLPMMMGKGPYGNLEMGGMFTVIKVRDDLGRDDYSDPGWFADDGTPRAQRVSRDPGWGRPPRNGV
ncbi:MAG: multicopper oxidase family protein [Gammaproteobacteria bacterium]|jgi:FtsP/CotA-like multicopper oxidase with cupredoxin domain